jgi:hypothetical protein
MSTRYTDAVWRTVAIPPLEQLVLLAIADNCSDEEGGLAWPSNEHLQWKTGVPERTIKRYKARWTSMGVLEIAGTIFFKKQNDDGPRLPGKLTLLKTGEPVPEFGRGTRPVYRLHIDLLPKKAAWGMGKKRGADLAPLLTQKGVGVGTLFDEKGANGEAKGCQIEQRNKEENRKYRTVSKNLGNLASELPRDPRFPQVCDAIRKCWPKKHKLTITPADAGAINRMLASYHDWKAEELALCIAARFESSSVNPTESPKAWIGAITDYQSGPQNKFKRPLWEGDAFKSWCNDARTILYGQQPEQLSLKPAQLPAAVCLPPDFDRDASSLWTHVLMGLGNIISRHSFDTWLKPTRGIGRRGNTFYIEIPNHEFSQIGQKYGDLIRAEFECVGVTDVEFLTRDELANHNWNQTRTA